MIAETTFELRERDGIALTCRKWQDEGIPRAVMVVAHGMGEHSGRYRTPLAPIVERGVVTFALDHRGHGESIQPGETPGDYGPGGFAGVVADLAALVDLARKEHPGLPLVLFGHSMGSMISQAFVLKHAAKIDALVLCGSAAVDVLAEAGARDPSIFANLNLPFEPERTPFDWLSRDEAEVDAYLADPLCGFALVPSSFVDLLGQGRTLADPEQITGIGRNLPILVMSGDRDPLNCQLHALDPLIDRYRAAGLKLTARLYRDGRHEVLNETNRTEVIADLASWIEDALALQSR